MVFPFHRRWATGLHRRWATGLVLAGLTLGAGCSSGDSTGTKAVPGTANTATGPTNVTSPADAACLRATFAQLTPAQRAGQLVMAGVPAGDPAAERTMVRVNHVGGVFLAGRSSHSQATLHAGLAHYTGERTASADIEPLAAVDQEGGKVQTLSGKGWTAIPAGTIQGRWSTAELAGRTRTWVTQLKRAGVTMDLAPVADTVPADIGTKNPPIGYYHRQYGDTPASVSRAITTVTTTMRAAGVVPTIKHFPGLGRVKANTDTSTKAVDPATTVTDPYLQPFGTGINAGAGAVMISLASYPKLDAGRLAVFSPAVITGLLRTKMRYQGVVISDDLGKAVAIKSVPPGQRATQFIGAGGDLVLTVLPKLAPGMVQAIIGKAQSDAVFRAQVDASVQRVLRLKQQYGLLTCS